MQNSAKPLIIAVCALLFQTTPALSKTLEECVREGGRHSPAAVAIACIDGKKYSFERFKREESHEKGNDIKGHEFRSSPITITKDGNEISIKGSLRHLIRLTRDEEVYYEIDRVGPNLIAIKTDIDHGGWGKLTGPMATIVASVPGVPVTGEQLKNFSERIRDALGHRHSDWQEVAKAIIVEIALRAN